MKSKGKTIAFDAVVERIAPEVPRFVVYPGKAWDETATFIVDVSVDVSLNGIPIGLRNLIPWKERGWHFGLSQPMCHTVGVDTGDRRDLILFVADAKRPETRTKRARRLLGG